MQLKDGCDVTRHSGVATAGLVLLAIGLAFQAAPGMAQDTFSLPAGTPSPTNRPAGPVDSDAPIVVPRPSASSTGAPAPPQATTPAKPPPRPSRVTRPEPATARPQPAPMVTASPAAVAPEPSATAAELPSKAPAAAPAVAADSKSDWVAFAMGALFGALVLLAAVGGLLWRRRERHLSAPASPIKPAPAPAPKAAPPPRPQPQAQPATDALQITLRARRLDASLVATTLAYDLRITNHGPATLNALAIEGDMVAAHASLPVEQQIANPANRLELRHALLELAPGASAEFTGELRLPLAAITPIKAGNSAYFVPLARLRLAAVEADSQPLVLAQTFVIGELPEAPNAALRPFRLDLGPRTFTRLGQRLVD